MQKSWDNCVCHYTQCTSVDVRSCDAEKVTIMQKLCTDEPWRIQHWGILKKQRMTLTNGRKLSRIHPLMLKHRYRNYSSCTQSKEQSKSSNLRISSAGNDDSCILAWSCVMRRRITEQREASTSTRGPVPKRVVWCVFRGWRDMESQRGDGCEHQAGKSCHRLRNGACKNPQVSMNLVPPLALLSTKDFAFRMSRTCVQAALARHDVVAKYGPDVLDLKPPQVCIGAT